LLHVVLYLAKATEAVKVERHGSNIGYRLYLYLALTRSISWGTLF
jgi:hypothetical protein